MADAPKKVPEYLARKNEGGMSDEDLRAVVQHALADCVQFVDSELSPDRANATKYYLGEKFGNEEEGRSQVVLTEVRDAVDGMLPSLLRVFFGSEHTVEFAPTRADNVKQAEQKTDYVRYVFEEDNSGFLRTIDVLKDGLIRKIGVFKWGWDATNDVQSYRLEGLQQSELEAIAADDTIDLKRVTPRAGVFDIEITRADPQGRARIWSVPPEEFFYNREARSVDDALVVGHRTHKTRGQLLAMGIPEKDIDAHGGETNASLRGNEEELARRQVISGGQSNDPELGKANDKVLYAECRFTVDFDGDGKAEQRRICTIGPNYYPVKNVPWDDTMGFAVFTPYPEPHMLTGGSVADRTMDVQKINSSILRAILDSGAQSIFPRTVYQEGQASVADIMNTAIGAPIRERLAGAVRVLETPFTGDKMMPVLAFMQEVVERRTGRNKGAAGLDADALQSTGKEAVGAVLTGSQEQIEIIARVFAEGTLKPLFRGIGRLLHSKQPKARCVRLRGEWVDVDPRSWDANMDVTVNVALGATFTEKKVATLMAVAADQKEMLMTMGLANPAVSLGQVLATRAKILSLQGIKDFKNYYNALPLDWQPPPPPAPPEDPEKMWIQAEKEMTREKNLKELAIKQDELKLREREIDLKERDVALKEADLALKREEVLLKDSFDHEKLALESELKRVEIETNAAVSVAQSEAQAAEAKQAGEQSRAPTKVQFEQTDTPQLTEALSRSEEMIATLMEHAAKERPPIIVPAPAVNVPAPVVNVPAPIVNVPERKRGKRRIKITKTDSGYDAESED